MGQDSVLQALEELINAALAKEVDPELDTSAVIGAKWKELFTNFKDRYQQRILENFHSLQMKLLCEQREGTALFERRNVEKWQIAFDHLEMMWHLAQELGQLQALETEKVNEQENCLATALGQLFPKGLLVTNEVICLLRGAFPDGALSRWRSLHEIATTILYLNKCGEPAAQAYLLSFHFSARQAARQINEYSERSGIEEFSEEEMHQFDQRCDLAQKILGRKISNDKSGVWPAITGKHNSFAEIEKYVGLDHWRPRYKVASVHNHASLQPNRKLLGMSEAKENVTLIGQSNSGFGDPFQMTAISLAQATSGYLLSTANPDRLVYSDVMLKLADEMPEIALKVENSP